MKQATLGSTDWALKVKVTRRAKFLAEMDAVIPWSRLLAVIEPHYPKAAQGRPPHPLPRMLRIHFMQQWFNLSDPAMEDALYDSESMRHFAGIDLTVDLVPDETTILRFRHLLEKHQLAEQLFAEVRALLEGKQLLLKSGTIVDATIIAAPPSTKNAAQARDPEMKQTRKGKQWRVSRTQAADLWCCTEDGSRPPEAGLQEQASNHPVLLRPKGAVVSDRAKVIP